MPMTRIIFRASNGCMQRFYRSFAMSAETLL